MEPKAIKKATRRAVAVALAIAVPGALAFGFMLGRGSVRASGGARAAEIEIAVRSIPEGAAIYLHPDNRFLGRTDGHLRVRMDPQTKVVVRLAKPGYLDEIRELTPYPMLVQLRPARAAAGVAVP